MFRKKKVFLLVVVLFLYALVITPLLIINLQKQQDPRGRAQVIQWATTQSATAQCSPTGEVQIAYSFTNKELLRSMKVVVEDQATTKSVDAGTVSPNQTVTGFVPTGLTSVTSGSVAFKLTWTGLFSQSDQKVASYNAITCQAPTPTPVAGNVCGNSPSDAMLVIDRSGSMNDKNGSTGTKLSNAKIAAKNFVDIMAKDPKNQLGLTSFATTATVNNPLTTNYASIKTQLDALKGDGGTCIECGIKKANAELKAVQTQAGRQGIKKIVVLLTDGRATTIDGSTKTVDSALAEQKAIEAAVAGNTESKTIFFTIGLGADVNESFLKKIATLTGGQYYFSPTTDQLNGIYQQISIILAKNSVSGFVFDDTNKNGVFNTGEPKLPGWVLQLTTGSSTTPKTVTSSDTGAFTFKDLCDGNYTLKEIVQQGWKQTLPANGAAHTFTIANGNSPTDKNFGNTKVSRCSDGVDNDNNGFTDTKDSTCHTDGNPNNPNSYDPNKDGETGGNTCADSKDNNGNGLIDGADPVCHPGGDTTKPWDPNLPEVNPATPTPAATTFDITVFQHGIGNSGDNTNPASSLSNKTPVHKSIDADLQLFNTANQLIGTGVGTITYDAATGNYKGKIGIYPPTFPTGNYYLKIKTKYHLRKLAEGIQTITGGKTTNVIPAVTVVAGDVNNDNKLDILDYNSLLDCYSDLAAAAACSDDKKVASDLNDDGSVNQVDYNLFLREISTQPGE